MNFFVILAHANLVYVISILVYVLPKQAHIKDFFFFVLVEKKLKDSASVIIFPFPNVDVVI